MCAMLCDPHTRPLENGDSAFCLYLEIKRKRIKPTIAQIFLVPTLTRLSSQIAVIIQRSRNYAKCCKCKSMRVLSMRQLATRTNEQNIFSYQNVCLNESTLRHTQKWAAQPMLRCHLAMHYICSVCCAVVCTTSFQLLFYDWSCPFVVPVSECSLYMACDEKLPSDPICHFYNIKFKYRWHFHSGACVLHFILKCNANDSSLYAGAANARHKKKTQHESK